MTKLPPTAALVMSVKAPPPILGEETSKTPPSNVDSVLKLCRKVIWAGPEMMLMFGVSRRLSLTVDGSSMKATLGAEFGVVVEVIHIGAAPAAFAATHPAGSAGALTPSKFSDNPAHPGVGVGGGTVGVGVTGGVGVGVHPGHGVGVLHDPVSERVSIPM